MQPFRSFIKTLAEQESNTQFLGKMLCQGVKHWPGITAPGTEPVDSLVKGIQVFAPDFSFDRLDAPIDIADDAPSLHKLMGCSNGRMIIDNAIQKVKERVSEHELDDKITAVLADIHAVGKVTSLDSVVSQLQRIDKNMPEIRSMKCTKIQFGKKTGAEQELKKLHSSLAAKPLAALQPLLELLKYPRNDSSHLELVVTALDDVDNFAGGEAFAQYIDGAATEAKKDTSKAGKLLCSHLSDVQERYEEAQFFGRRCTTWADGRLSTARQMGASTMLPISRSSSVVNGKRSPRREQSFGSRWGLRPAVGLLLTLVSCSRSKHGRRAGERQRWKAPCPLL